MGKKLVVAPSFDLNIGAHYFYISDSYRKTPFERSLLIVFKIVQPGDNTSSGQECKAPTNAEPPPSLNSSCTWSVTSLYNYSLLMVITDVGKWSVPLANAHEVLSKQRVNKL